MSEQQPRRDQLYWIRNAGEGLPEPRTQEGDVELYSCCDCGKRYANPIIPINECLCGGTDVVSHEFEREAYARLRWYGDPRPQEYDPAKVIADGGISTKDIIEDSKDRMERYAEKSQRYNGNKAAFFNGLRAAHAGIVDRYGSDGDIDEALQRGAEAHVQADERRVRE